MAHATGSFDVKIAPQSDDFLKGSSMGRMSIDKQFHGDLEATSKGEMLTGGDVAKGSAGYVAIEQVTGKLERPQRQFHLAAQWHHDPRHPAAHCLRRARFRNGPTRRSFRHNDHQDH